MRAVVAHKQPKQSEPVRHALLGLGLECGVDDCVPFQDLAMRLSKGPVDLVVVTMTTSEPSLALGAIQQAVSQAAVPVLAVGPTCDAHQILQTTRTGAREYLDENRVQEDLEAALDKLRQAGVVKNAPSLTVAVLSATPGSGVTTVATNLAFTWAEQFPELVTLVELGHASPELALALDLDPRHTVADLAENWERMDMALLKRTLVPHAGGVQVLAYLAETLAVAPLPPQAVRKALVLMRSNYRASVLDLGHSLGEEHAEALRLADEIVIVVRLDVPGVRQTRRLAQLLEEWSLPRARLRFVANRYGQKGQLSVKKAEEALGQPFAELIPEDSLNQNQALNQGQPVVRLVPRAPLSQSFAKLAAKLKGEG